MKLALILIAALTYIACVVLTFGFRRPWKKAVSVAGALAAISLILWEVN